jgi:GAF domain-containing protein
MAAKYIIPSALIMKIDSSDIKVFLSSKSEGNPYEVGNSDSLVGSGLYCERVIKTKSKLLVANALIDSEWHKNPDIKLNMISYVGFPILLPNEDVFGTICMLDSKENSYEGDATNTLELFKKYIESYLDFKTSKALQSNSDEIAKKEMLSNKLFSRIEKTLGTRD